MNEKTQSDETISTIITDASKIGSMIAQYID